MGWFKANNGDCVSCVDTVYHPLRYNTSVGSACARSPCSHLCLLVPGGRRCACPDQQQQPKRITQELTCDAGNLPLFATLYSSYNSIFSFGSCICIPYKSLYPVCVN